MPESHDIIDELIAATQRLNDWADEVERLVFEARSQGYTWVDLGEAFGVTKQAVQQRFSRPRPAGAARAVRPLQHERLFVDGDPLDHE